ncbi:MAG: tetratricopeptide repeat protein [Bacteroidetes bacterium]|nr:tetratricopeptide repeat protein [Bacteroidota bacterium]
MLNQINYFLLLVILIPLFSFSQQVKIDSLKNILSSAKEDSSKEKILLHLSTLLSRKKPEPAMEYANQALALGKKLGNKKFIASSYNTIGTIYRYRGEYDKALENNFSSLSIYKEIKDSAGIAAVLNNVGNVYYHQGKFSKALENYLAALKTREAMHDKQGVASSFSNMGMVYGEEGDFTNSLDYFLKSLKIREEIGDKEGIGISLNNIGEVFSKKGSYREALDYHLRALKVREEINDKKGTAESLVILGDDYLKLGDESSSLKYFLKSLDLFEETNNKNGIGNSLMNIGQLYYRQNNYPKALEYLMKGLSVAKEIQAKPQLSDGYKILSEVYSRKNDFKNAYEYHKLFSDMKDSLLNEESSKQITEMQTKYETEKKEQQITLLNKDKELQDAQLNRQKIIIWSVVGGLLIVVLLSIFIFRERKKSEKLLLNILPVETAKELKQKGKASSKYYESVTVMFTDFKGFTAIAEKLSAEELVSELDFLFKKFDEIISKYNIEKIKTIGDAYMCASGLPTSNTNHAENIVKAGLEIQQWMIARNGKWNLRIGIHSGPVTAGVVGDKKFAYDIWGDTVNTASRMESSGEAGKINISGATYQILQGFQNLEGLEFKFRGKIPAKNKGEIEMYFVERSETPMGAETPA